MNSADGLKERINAGSKLQELRETPDVTKMAFPQLITKIKQGSLSPVQVWRIPNTAAVTNQMLAVSGRYFYIQRIYDSTDDSAITTTVVRARFVRNDGPNEIRLQAKQGVKTPFDRVYLNINAVSNSVVEFLISEDPVLFEFIDNN